MSYLGRGSNLTRKAQDKVSFLATAGQTVRTGLSYVPTHVDVTVNGITLTEITDYTATNGNSITFTVALALNDEVTIVSSKTFDVANHYTISAANTLLAAKAPLASPSFTGNVNFAGEQLKLSGSGSQTYVAALNTGSGEAGFFMDASNGDLSGSDYAWIKQKNNLDVEIGSAASTNRHLLFSPDGSEKMRITNSGHVGIGSTSPLALLDLKGSTDTYATMAKIYLTDLNSNSGSRNWSIGNGGSGYGNLTFGVSNAQNGNPQIAGGGHTNPLVITSSGTVTKPLQPAFSAGRNAGNVTSGVYIGNVVHFNIGGHYSASTGKFTAPVAGRYQISSFLMSNTGVWDSKYYGIRINNVLYKEAYGSTSGSTHHHQWNWSGVINLNANDYVTIVYGDFTIYGNHINYSAFSGYLIG